VTTVGRLIAAGLMIGGLALVGIVTATFASWLVQKVDEAAESSSQQHRAGLESLSDEVEALRAQVATLTASLAGPGGQAGRAEQDSGAAVVPDGAAPA
ncbi:MAG: hypothetical protein LBR19_08600, partial [Bifidobacteriaceae bacterium]|nr:hypothetical protein [Bifidobacteriaceae bacterium]